MEPQPPRSEGRPAPSLTSVAAFVFAATVCASCAKPGGSPTSEEVKKMKAENEQTFDGLAFVLPEGFEKRDDRVDAIGSPIPGAPPTREHFRSYESASTGKGLFLFHWDGIPYRDRGPMVAAESWPAKIGGQPATVTRTKYFFGRAQEVLVAHFAGPVPDKDRFMIYTTLVDKVVFGALLASARFAR
jgi:hypothetical protein